MSELAALQAEVAHLKIQLAEVTQTVDAFKMGQVDAVAQDAGVSPVLLQAAQDNLRQSEQLLRAIFDGALDAILLADDSGRYTDANPAACVLFGLTRRELLGRTLGEFATPGYSPPAEWGTFIERGHMRGSFPLLRLDGGRRDLEFTAVANILPGTHLSVLRDVTDRRRSEELRNRLATVVEWSLDAIISKTLDGTIVAWNRGAEALFGYSADEAVGQPISILLPPDGTSDETLIMERVARGESLAYHESPRRRKDGSIVDVGLVMSPIRDGSGQVVAVSTIARDLTERRQAEEALRRSEEQFRHAQKVEAVGVLAGGVAHDFNNILSIVLTYSSMLLDELGPEHPLYDDVKQIAKAGERAAELTRQLLAFSRKQMLQPQVLNLGHVVAGMEKMVRRLVPESVTLNFVTSTDLGRVFADAGQLEQTIMNLIVNARDAMPDGGTITIETVNAELDGEYAATHLGVTAGRYVMLAVTDTGVGIAPELRDRIFEPFFTTKEKGKGTGLGLSTVFGIVKQSGGHISVYSEPGTGTTFKIYLPRTDDAAEAISPSKQPPPTTGGTETVLLVEDDDQLRQVAHTILHRHGYNVLEAANGGEALLRCEEFKAKIHLLVTDVIMPRMTGKQLADRIALLRPEMKVLFMSGYTDDSIVHHGIVDAGIAFIQKPLSKGAFLQKIREVLDDASVGGAVTP